MPIRRRHLLFALYVVACASPTASPDTGTTGTGTDSNAGSTMATPTEASSSTAATPTEASGSTGDAPPDACDPDLPPIPEDLFVETYAATICQQKADCGCTTDFACETSFATDLQAILDWGQAQRYAYDGACAARLLADFTARQGCRMASEIDLSTRCWGGCPVYRGDGLPGDACPLPPQSKFALFSLYTNPCTSPDACDWGAQACAAPLPVVGTGSPCATDGPKLIARCEFTDYCAIETLKCTPRPTTGEPCTGFNCAEGNACPADTMVCTPRRATGEPCNEDGECQTDRCTANTCADWLWICEVGDLLDLFARNPD